MNSKEKLKELESAHGVLADFDGDGVGIYDNSTDDSKEIAYYTMDQLFEAFTDSGENVDGVWDFNDPGDSSGHGQVIEDPYESADDWLQATAVVDIEIFAITHHFSIRR